VRWALTRRRVHLTLSFYEISAGHTKIAQRKQRHELRGVLGQSLRSLGSSLAFILFESLFRNPTHGRLVNVKHANNRTHAVATRGVGLRMAGLRTGMAANRAMRRLGGVSMRYA
jgi:hypothetical protein